MDASPTKFLLELIDEAYDRKAWHGPNLRGSIRRVDAGLAVFRPAPGRHNIAEQVVHAAYWKYTVRRLLLGQKRGSFALSGSNWFPVDGPPDSLAWKAQVRLLDAEHRALREAIASVPEDLWSGRPAGSKVSRHGLVRGIAAHDVYHAGQIQILKRLRPV